MQPQTELLLTIVLSGMIGSYIGKVIATVIDLVIRWKEGRKKP